MNPARVDADRLRDHRAFMKGVLLGAVEELLAHRFTLAEVVAIVTRMCIDVALERMGGNVTHAARALGIHRNTIHYIRRRKA